jgi:hypothetical protein
MTGQRVFIIIALVASLCVALPTTDLVVPEAKDAGTTGAKFVQSTLKSGGTLDAVDQDTVEYRSHANPSVLTATDAISAELTSIKKSAKSNPGVAQIESTVLSMTKAMNDTDGGTKDMDDRLNTAVSSINTAVDIMLSGTKTDYDSAKVDLKTLDDAIDNNKKTISTTDLETIRTAATAWCTKKRELETATTDKQAADQTLTNKLNAPLDVSNLKLKDVGPIGEGDCSQSHGDAEGSTSCPVYSCSDDNLAQIIKEKIAIGRTAYLTASWDKYNKDAALVTATSGNTAKKAIFEDKVETTASTYHSMCGSDDTVHATAVTSFNANNANRASMYLSLGIIKCHTNHMKSGQSYVFTPADLLKSASSNSATSSTDCIANLQTAANIKAALFPDASSNEDSSKVCPTLNVYVQEVHDYGGFGFHKTDWDADVAKCSAAASVPPAPAPPPPPPAAFGATTWLSTTPQPGWTACMQQGLSTTSCGSISSFTHNNYHGVSGAGCASNGRSSLLVKTDGMWAMSGFRYDDQTWVPHEKVTQFRIEYSNDLSTWTSVFETADAVSLRVGNSVEVSFTPVAAANWRWVLEAHNCATVASEEWKGIQVS